MKLHKYANGGAFTSSFVADKRTVNPEETVKARNIFNPNQGTTDSGKPKNIVDDSLFNDAIKKGLTNEVSHLVRLKEELSEKIQDGTYSASDVSRTMLAINKVIRNANERDEVEGNLAKNEARDDIYFTSNNQVLVQDSKGNINQISASQYLQASPKEKSQYKLITNSEVFNMRSKSDNFAFNETIFNDLKQAPTTKEYYKEVSDFLGNVESNKFKSSLKDLPPNIRKQMMEYKQAVEEGNQEKIHQIVTGKTFISGINRSINSKINPRLKQYMELIAGMNGNTLESYLSDIVNSHLGFSDIQYKDTTSSSDSSSGGFSGGAKGDFNDKIAGRYGRSEVLPINTGSDINLNLTGEYHEQLQVNKEGENVAIEPTTLKDALHKSGLDLMINKRKVFIGDKKISSDEFDSMMNGLIYNNSSVMTVDVPVNINGDIDFEMTEKVSKMLKETNDIKKLNAKLEKSGIPGIFKKDKNGIKYTGNNTKPFIVLTASEVDGDIIDVDENELSTLINDSKKAAVLATYQRILENNEELGDNTSGFFNFSHPVASAPIFLQMSESSVYEADTYYKPKVALEDTRVFNQMERTKIDTNLSLDSLK